jgi:hypothetical protein
MPSTLTDQYIDHPALHNQPHNVLHSYPAKLYVVTVLFNPLRWISRYRHYEAFEKRVADAGAILYTVEAALENRLFEVTTPTNPRHIQVRVESELWLKENLLNLGFSRLPPEAKKIAWVDADVNFQRLDWAQETLQQLAHYDVIQMFSHAMDLGPNFEPIGQTLIPSFMFTYEEERKFLHEPVDPKKFDERSLSYPYPVGVKQGPGWHFSHPGFAWAARRSAIDSLGGLIDWAILGSGDWHMANALIGKVDRSLSSGYSDRYKFKCRQWQDRAERYVIHNPEGGVGCMPGLITHSFHGRKANRMYDKRWKALVATNYDPDLDIKKDMQGVWQLTDHNSKLRDALRDYGRARLEDANEV